MNERRKALLFEIAYIMW